jgi:uncharacterized membrane protein YczE
VKEKLSAFFLLVGWLLVIYGLTFFVKSSIFISTLESNRVSIYFFCDALLVSYTIIGFFYIITSRLKVFNSNVVFIILNIFVFIIAVRWAVMDNYPNVPRKDIGYFYIIPKGETITYPKYPRNTYKNPEK